MNNTLHQAFPIVAAALGEKLGVRVLIEGQSARTDGDKIVLPAYDGTDPQYQDITWGYLAHEAAHLRFTDFEVFRSACTTPLRKALLNILEDVRIEGELAKLYPGTRITIEKTVEHLIQTGGFRLPEATDHPAALFQAVLLLELRFRVLGQRRLEALSMEAMARLQAVLPDARVSQLSLLGLEVTTLRSTEDALDLADRIIDVLKSKLDEGSDPKVGAPRFEDDRENATDDSPLKDPMDQDTGNPLPAVSEGDKGTCACADQKRSSPMQRMLDAEETDLCEDLFDRVRASLALSKDQAKGFCVPVAEDPPIDPVRGKALLQKALIDSGRLRAALLGWVEANRMNRPVSRRSGHQVISQRLYRIGLKDPRVFQRKGNRKAPHAAVHLLLDRSPSMSALVCDEDKVIGRRIDLALEACLSLALALEGIAGVNLGITAFPGKDGDALSVYRVLSHGESVRQRSKACALDLDGSTPLAEAIGYAGSKLLLQPEPRRILLVLTDGIPDDLEAARSILGRCKASNIEVIGMGLGIEVHPVFEHALTVMQMGDLPRRLHQACKTLLTEA